MSCSECGRDPCTHHQLGANLIGGNNADSGMACSTWGSPRWFSLHMATFGYPVKPTKSQQTHMHQLVHMWEHELPCCCCRANYRKHLRAVFNPSVLKSRASFTRFGFNLHNAVNKSLDKRVLDDAEFAKVKRYYESCRAGRAGPIGHSVVILHAHKDIGTETHLADVKVMMDIV